MSELDMMQWEQRLPVLLDETKAGNNRAATELINHYQRKLYFIARSYTSNDADANDIVQNVWIKALRSIGSLSEYSKFEAWIATIARNESLSLVTSASQKKNLMFSDLDNTEDGLIYDVEDERVTSRPDLQYSDTARREIIQDILSRLPENQRVVTLMHFYDQMSAKEIADQLGVPMSTVTGRLQHAKETIKAAVSDLQKRDGIKLYEMTPLPFFIYLMQIEAASGWLPSTLRVISSVSPGITASAAEIAAAMQAGTAVSAAATAAGSASVAGTAAASAAEAGAQGLAGTAATITHAQAITSASTVATVSETAAASSAAAGTVGSAAAVSEATAIGGGAAAHGALAAPVAVKTGITAGHVIGAVAAAGAVGAGALIAPVIVERLQEPKTIQVLDNAVVSFSGYNGHGSAELTFEDTGDEALNELLRTGTCTFDDNGNYINGLPAAVSCEFDTEAANQSGYVLENTEGYYVVDGLVSLKDIDLFEDVSVEWATDEEAHTAEMVLNAPTDDPYGIDAKYEIVSQDDAGNAVVHAFVSLERMNEKGYQALDGIYDRKYSLGRIPDTYRDERLDCTAQDGTWNNETHTCTFAEPEQEPAQPVNTEQMTPQGQAIVNAAYAQLGSTDLCSLVVNNALNAIGVDCFVGSPTMGYYIDTHTIRDKGYWVATPQPGDVAYYDSNFSGTSSHVAIYIGNGKVISGNFNGSTQIVNAYIGGQQSQPQYYRYY